jgi:hypothetical protein
MHSNICTAIREHRRLRFDYGGGSRLVDPYVYGACETHQLLRGYQVDGFSPSRARGWKLFRVEEIENLVVLDEQFSEVHIGYMRNDPSMEVVYSEI